MPKKKTSRGGARPNSGPKPADGEGYGKPLFIRAKQSQLDNWQEVADASGVSLSQWVREALDAAWAKFRKRSK